MRTFSQLFPPAPTFTEKNLVDLSSKVYIITGATSGVGFALAKILYNLHATIYIGARTLAQFNSAASTIKSVCPTSKGTLKPFIADLASLKTIKPAVSAFLQEEYRLDVLFLNAGVMTPPPGSKTKDDYDLELGTNCLSSFLLVSLFSPLMHGVSAHFCHPNASIRVVWVSSLLNINTPPGGVQLDSAGVPEQFKAMENYMQSKAGIYLLSQEFAHRQSLHRKDVDENGLGNRNPNGVLHVCLHPGFMKTELQRHEPPPMRFLIGAVLKEPKHGAYTELYAGLAPDVKNGDFVIPWGRKGEVPEHIVNSMRAKEGEKCVGERFYEWCEEQVRPFM